MNCLQYFIQLPLCLILVLLCSIKCTVKPVLSGHSKKAKNLFSRPIIASCRSKASQNAHSAMLSNFIKLPSVIEIDVLSIFEWPLKTGFTVLSNFAIRESWLSSWCLVAVSVLCRFLAVLWVGLWSVIVLFPGHYTHFNFFLG